MSLTSEFHSGLAAVTAALPDNPYAAGGIVAAVAGAAIAAGWTAANPVRMLTTETMPTLTQGRPLYRESSTPATAVPLPQAAAAPLTVPLDVVPVDEFGRTPYDIVSLRTLRMVVDQFYSRLCADAELADFFHHIDMAQLKKHQVEFISQLWGGPMVIDLERLAEVHQGLHISADRYWRVAGHLMTVLTHLDVPDWICVFTMTRLYQARNLIVTQAPVPAPEPPEPDAAGQPGPDTAAEA